MDNRPDTGGIEARDAPTVRDLWHEYEAVHLPTKRPRSAADDRSMWQTYILPRLGPMKLKDLSAADIDALHASIANPGHGQRPKPVRANRVLEVLRKALNLAKRWKWTQDNPCTGFRRSPEEGRERFLTLDELRRIGEALEAVRSPASADAIRFLMVTGARKSEVLAARWDMFNLETGIWIKPSAHTKQAKVHRVPLSAEALSLLRRIRTGEKADPKFVFPGSGRSGHITDVKRTWASICEKAGVPHVRLHDLRHTFASILVSNSIPLEVIGRLLGHTQVQTTKRYAHLYDDPLRLAADIAGQHVQGLNARNVTDGADVGN